MTPGLAEELLTYNVAGLLGEPPGSSRSYAIAGVILDLGPDLVQADPVEGAIRVARTNRGILVTGRLTTSLAMTCSRCLREIEVPLVLMLEEEVLPSIDLVTGLALDTGVEPDLPRLTDHHELELEPLVREAIQLAEPIAPLCRIDCPGLCVVCGRELAEGGHEHGPEAIDARLEALRGFRVDDGGDPG
ncbi:MAG: YceD family protein [Chloroflexota bacterium]